MSTNPFRRSSLRDPSGSSENYPPASAPIDIVDSGSATPPSLSVNTKVTSTTQKHVNFASPPAIPISPISYPPSPESVRFSPALTNTRPILPQPTDYSEAIQGDTFQAEAELDDDDGAIEQALQNAKANTVVAAPDLEASRRDAVRNTLSRFASAPKRPAPNRDAGTAQPPAGQRLTMDVDAFKRLLLTGDSGQTKSQEDHVPSTAPLAYSVMNDNSSATDTASISQRSLFDPSQATDESPRSSEDMDTADIEAIHQSLAPSSTVESRKKPPPPAPRHGKPIKGGTASELDSSITPADAFSTTAKVPKQPPTPPLARRRSQNAVPLPTSSRKSSSSELEQPITLHENGQRAPPPPPRPRRPVSMAERRSSSDLPTTVEESDSTDASAFQSRKASDSKPAPPPARNSSRRTTPGSLNPPPLPAPRRGRGSSRSSVDSQQLPVATMLGISATDGTADEQLRTEAASSSGNDILADLAALQREVDEARQKVNKG